MPEIATDRSPSRGAARDLPRGWPRACCSRPAAAAAATCTTNRGTTRSRAASFFEDGTSARPLVPGTVPQFDRRDAAGADDVTVLLTGREGGREATEAAVPARPPGPRARAAALPDLLHAVPRRARRRPGDDRQARVHAAPAVHQRTAAQRAAGALLRGHHARSRGDVLVCRARPACATDGRSRPTSGPCSSASMRPSRTCPPRTATSSREPRHEHDCTTTPSPTTRCGRVSTGSRARALLIGGVGLALCLAGGLIWPGRFFASYLVAFLYWIGITLGCIGLTMLHHLVGGQWGLPIRRPMEAGASTVLPLAVLFLPPGAQLADPLSLGPPGGGPAGCGARPQVRVPERAFLPRPYGVLLRRLGRVRGDAPRLVKSPG